MTRLITNLLKRPNLEKAVIISHIFFIVFGLPFLSIGDDNQLEQDDIIGIVLFLFLTSLFFSYVFFLDQRKNFLSITIKWILIILWTSALLVVCAVIINNLIDPYARIIGSAISDIVIYFLLIVYLLPSVIYLFFKITKVKVIALIVFLSVGTPVVLVGYYSFTPLLLNIFLESLLDEYEINDEQWDKASSGVADYIPNKLRKDYLLFVVKVINKDTEKAFNSAELLKDKTIKLFGINSKEEAFIKIGIGNQLQELLEYKYSYNYMSSGISILEELIRQNKFSNQKEKTDLYDCLAYAYYYNRVNVLNSLEHKKNIEISLKFIELLEKNKVSEKFYKELFEETSKNNYLILTMTALSDSYYKTGLNTQGMHWAEQAMLISQNQDVSLFVRNLALAAQSTSLYYQGKIFESIKIREETMANAKKSYHSVVTDEMLSDEEIDRQQSLYATSMNNLALAYLDSGIKFGEIENLLLDSIKLMSDYRPNDIMLLYPYYNLGNYYVAINDRKKSKEFFLKAIEIVELNISQDPGLLILPILALVQMHLNENNLIEASNLIKRAENIFSNDNAIERIGYVGLMITKAKIHYASGQYNKAIETLEPLIKSAKTDREMLSIKTDLLDNYLATHQYDLVASKVLKIEKLIYEQSIKNFDTIVQLNRVASIYGNLERLDPENSIFSGRSKYQRWEEILHDILTFIPDNIDQNNITFAFIYHDLALINHFTKNYSEAIKWGGKMKKILTRKLMNGTKFENLQADQLREQKSFGDYFNAHTQILIEHVTREIESNEMTKEGYISFLKEILENVQLTMSSRTAITLSKMAEVGASKNQELTKLHKRISINEIQIENLRTKIAEQLLQPISGANNKINQANRERVADLENENDKTRIEIYFENPYLSQFTFMEPVQYEELKNLLKDDEAIIIFNKNNFSDYILYITKEDLFVRRIELSYQDYAGIRQSIDDFRENINLSNISHHFPVKKAYGLYKKLISGEKANNQILNNKKHLIIIPSTELINFPFWTLVTEDPPKINNSSDYKNIAWIANKYALSILPSVHNFKILRSQKKEKISRASFIGFGDPLIGDQNENTEKQIVQPLDLNEFFNREGKVDINEIKKLPRLQETEIELSKIAEYLNADENSLYLQGRATEQNLKNLDLSTTDILMFATHALVAGEINSIHEPGIVLTPPEITSNGNDGLLTSSEIMNLNLNAEWVILSACNTASGNQFGAEPLSGLARAFFFAGAKSLLVSNWPVESQSAVKITTRMFYYLSKEEGMSKSEALRKSIVALIQEEEREFASHPMFWAPFMLVGDGI